MGFWRECHNEALAGGKLRPESAENIAAWRGAVHLPQWAKDSINCLLEREKWDELNDRFFTTTAFGTAGIRGRVIGNYQTPQEVDSSGMPINAAVGSTCINDVNIARATMALYNHCENWLLCHSDRFDIPKLVIAYDNRFFSRHFAEISAGIWKILGGHALVFDSPRSTPQLSFFVRHLHATAGVVITASHNPYHDNGFKAYFADGAQVVEPHASAITSNYNGFGVEDVCLVLSQLNGEEIGYKFLPQGVDEIYRQCLEESIVDRSSLDKYPISIAYSPLHGTGYAIMKPLLESLNVQCYPVEDQCQLDPNFSTVKLPNPEIPEAFTRVIQLANEKNIDLAIATDPDADRMAIACRNRDGQMEILTGNQTAVLLAAYRLEAMNRLGWFGEKNFKNAAIIASYVTTPLLDVLAKEAEIKIIRTLIGFKWIGEKLQDYEEKMKAEILRATGHSIDYQALSSETKRELLLRHSTFFILGAEESCGYMGCDRTRDKDSHAAVAMICELFSWLRSQQLTALDYLDKIYGCHGYYGECLHTIYYPGADGLDAMNQCLKSFTTHPLTALAGKKITHCMDFSKDHICDADGKVIAKQAFWILDFEDDFRLAFRASGTEPKMKCYLFYRGGKSTNEAKRSAKIAFEGYIDAFQSEIDRRTKKK
ncbi:MAG: phospho-sugar mutase [Puniceicoccales bacterium]|jgi:phosphoglucomutase|nr:phospho-sugar mutase [Puniceicoccales bacterium]